MFAVVRQAQTYLGALICLSIAGVLRGVFPEQTYTDLVVFELYTTAQLNILAALVAPVLMVTAPAAFSVASIALWMGVHAIAGPGFFGSTWKGWLLPPLAVAAVLVAIAVISGIAGFVWALFAVS